MWEGKPTPSEVGQDEVAGNMSIRAVLASVLIAMFVCVGCKPEKEDFTYVVTPGTAAQTGEYQITLTRDWQPKHERNDVAAGGEFENRKYGAELQILFYKAEAGDDWFAVRQKNEDLFERLQTRPGFIEIFGEGFFGGIDITTPKSPGGNVPHARIKGFMFGSDGFFTITGESRHPLDERSTGEMIEVIKGLRSSRQVEQARASDK